MHALSLTQPWASLLIGQEKRVETRSWSSNRRGWIAIHATKTMPEDAHNAAMDPAFTEALGRLGLSYSPGRSTLPLGAILGVARLTHIVRIKNEEVSRQNYSPRERHFGNFAPGRYAWLFDMTHPFDEPIPCRGYQLLWSLPPDVLPRVRTLVEHLIRP